MLTFYHVFVSGQVQGVGYRAWTRDKALELGLKGWVRNLSDRRVEALLCGQKSQIEQMLIAMESGPILSKVTGITQEEVQSNQEFETFSVEKSG